MRFEKAVTVCAAVIFTMSALRAPAQTGSSTDSATESQQANDSAAAVRDELESLKNRHAVEMRQLEARLKALEATSAPASGGAPMPRQAVTRDLALPFTTPPFGGFEFNGYLRSGFGVNGHGGHQVAFQAPGADAKYRLGNEAETYLETALSKHFIMQPDRPFFKMQVRLSYKTDQDTAAGIHEDGLALREAFVEAGDFDWGSGVKFWAGQRFYRRLDIHINDYYILDMSGYGGGIEDLSLALGDVKLAAAYLGGSSDDYEFPKTGRVAKNCLDLRIYDIPAPLGSGTLWIAPSSVKGGEYTEKDSEGQSLTHTYESSLGGAIGAIHEVPLPNDGMNRFSIQYGRGAGSDFSPVVEKPSPGLDDAWRFRVADSTLLQTAGPFTMMSALIYQVFDNGENDSSRITWISGGLRPIYSFTRHVALAAEFGADWVDNEPDDCRGILYKFTVAPELRIGPAFLDRPVLRAYFTYATWGNGLEGKVGESAYMDATAGIAAGLQCEAWW